MSMPNFHIFDLHFCALQYSTHGYGICCLVPVLCCYIFTAKTKKALYKKIGNNLLLMDETALKIKWILLPALQFRQRH